MPNEERKKLHQALLNIRSTRKDVMESLQGLSKDMHDTAAKLHATFPETIMIHGCTFIRPPEAQHEGMYLVYHQRGQQTFHDVRLDVSIGAEGELVYNMAAYRYSDDEYSGATPEEAWDKLRSMLLQNEGAKEDMLDAYNQAVERAENWKKLLELIYGEDML